MKRDNFIGKLAVVFFHTPRLVLLFFIILILLVVACNQFIGQRRIQWEQTNAFLIKTRIDERLRNKVKEQALSLTYRYEVGGITEQAFLDEMVLDLSQAAARETQIRKNEQMRTIFYQEDNPEQYTFNEEDTKPDYGLVNIIIPMILFLGGLCFWFIRIAKQYGS